MARIEASGGTVKPLRSETGEPMGPERAWKKGCEYPGLAMSRSIGDKLGKEIGVIAEPEITKFPYDPTT